MADDTTTRRSRWPRGRYNGKRIVGFDLRVLFDVTARGFCLPNRYGRCLGLGPLRIWIEAAYE